MATRGIERAWSVAAALALAGCAHRPGAPAARLMRPARSVTPEQCLAIAEAYRTLRWTPRAANVLHGPDADGAPVNTPDAAAGGWWRVGTENEAMPYAWGGFDTPQDFERKIARGAPAGDRATAAKRSGAHAISRRAAGVDCSGLISRCWRLRRHVSTAALPALCDPVADWRDLRPGDIINRPRSHVLLFAGWADPQRRRMFVYDTGWPTDWKVARHAVPTRFLSEEEFSAWRYRRMRPR